MDEKRLTIQRLCQKVISGLLHRKLPVLQTVNPENGNNDDADVHLSIDPLRAVSVDPRTTKGLWKYCQILAIVALISKLLAGKAIYLL